MALPIKYPKFFFFFLDSFSFKRLFSFFPNITILGIKILKLPELTEEEKRIIDPIVAPTSSLKIQVLDVEIRDGKERYLLPLRKFFLFLRVFKAISQKFKDMKKNQNLKILIVSDNRPSKDILPKYCSQIFSHERYEVYYQTDDKGRSRIFLLYR